MEVTLRNLSYDTLVGIVEDFDISNTLLKDENKRLSTNSGSDTLDWKSKYYDLESKYNSLSAQNQQQQDTHSPSEEQIKHDVLQSMIDNTIGLSDTQAVTLFGLIAEAGQKTIAIKAYQKFFGTGLKKSEKAIEQWRELGALRYS